MRVVVIGGGAAGASAAARARRLAPDAEVTLVEATGMITHAPCGIPYALSGLVPSYRMLRTYSPERFASERRIEVLTNAVAEDVDVDGRTVAVRRDGSVQRIRWDALVLATGARPIVPKLEGVEDVRPLTFRHPEEVTAASARLGSARRVAVIGGGYIGVELTEALVDLGKEVILFEMMDRLLPGPFDPEVSKVLEEAMKAAGVQVRLSEPVRYLSRKGGRVVVGTDGSEEEVDDVVVGIGVRPNIELAVKAGIKLGHTGAVETDDMMSTNVDGVFAAGDLVEKFHLVLRRKVWIPLAPAANKEGQVAGANAVVRGSLRMRGIVGTAVTRFKDLYLARTGLGQEEAARNGLDVESTAIVARTKAGYFPGGVEVTVKMVAERSSGKVLGVQVVGRDPIVAAYADLSAVMVERGMTIEDVFFSDIGYMPATAPVWHPLIVAARTLSKGRF
ncbi:MAG: FAD-dependent oxidoreductase [Thaumarchaeota archaeon]|nr:FAD-dependent oxidoreductase [Candidatus Calditenuaceae archaeon]MDW8043183.1 FAD-dependent oxidoreductase [Nitrososphaerota archaeon]